jgi:hypothetical protein
MTHRISTTMRPDQPIDVGDAEYLDLKRQGLIAHDYTRQPAAPVPPPAPAARTATTKKAAPSATSKED